MNLETAFRVSLFMDFLPRPAESWQDQFISDALTIFVDLKAFAVFSLLFGVGLAIQYERLQGHPARLQLLLRRLLALLGFGLVHLCLIWNGDILTEYAIAGLIALPLLYAPTLVLLAVCVALLTFYVAIPLLPLPQMFSLPDLRWMADHVHLAQLVYGSGRFMEILKFRIQEIPAILPLHYGIFPRTLGLFLLGVLTWRMRLVELASRRRGAVGTLAVVATLVGLASSVGSWTRHVIVGFTPDVLSHVSTIALGVGYSSVVLAAANLGKGRRVLSIFAPLGRMAFSNYITQSIVLGVIFYAYGYGLFGRLGVTTGLLIAIVLYIVQLVVSYGWLQRYRFGPLEWLWRALMYGHWQPMRR
jgi:uncharacterized protein